MNKQAMQSVLKDLTEQRAPSAQIDLWPAIQSRVQMSQSIQSRGTIMSTQSNSRARRLKPAFILAAVVLIGAVFFALPQGRALAQEILHFFNRGESNLMPGVTVTPVKWVEQTPGVAAATLTPQPTQAPPAGPVFEAACGSLNDPHCSIEAIRGMADFPVMALAELPEGMVFTGASGDPDRILLVYTAPDQTGTLTIWEEPFTGAEGQLAGEVGADADIQQVLVGAVSAEYVKGSYDGSSNPPVWNSSLDVQTLRWVDQGILFNLWMLGAQPRLGRDDLAALAATLTDGPLEEAVSAAAETAIPAPTAAPFDPRSAYPLTLAEVEELAGFAPLSPSRLPETPTFIGAAYDEKTQVVELYYRYNHPNFLEATDALIVREQLAPAGADCDLCGFVRGDGKQLDQYPSGKLVSQDAAIETVEIGTFAGEFIEGVGWTGTDCCGWQWDDTPYIKRLRFRTDHLAIDVTAFTLELTRADMLAVAESMK